MASLLSRLLAIGLTMLLVGVLYACGERERTVEMAALPVPKQPTSTYVTDQAELAGQVVSLWYEDTGCRLQIRQQGKQQGTKKWLKPGAPCYFIRSPGSDRVQIYQHDKTIQVIAVIGTPVEVKQSVQRCGREVQGLIINSAGEVTLSKHVHSGSIYCANQGLDNFQYSLFAHP